MAFRFSLYVIDFEASTSKVSVRCSCECTKTTLYEGDQATYEWITAGGVVRLSKLNALKWNHFLIYSLHWGLVVPTRRWPSVLSWPQMLTSGVDISGGHWACSSGKQHASHRQDPHTTYGRWAKSPQKNASGRHSCECTITRCTRGVLA